MQVAKFTPASAANQPDARQEEPPVRTDSITVDTLELSHTSPAPVAPKTFSACAATLERQFWCIRDTSIREPFLAGFVKMKGEACVDYMTKHRALMASFYSSPGAECLAHLIEQGSVKQLLDLVDGNSIPMGLNFPCKYRPGESEREVQELIADGEFRKLHEKEAIFKAILRHDLAYAEFLLTHGGNPFSHNLSRDELELLRRLRISDPFRDFKWVRLFASHQKLLTSHVTDNIHDPKRRHLVRQDPFYGDSWAMLPPLDQLHILSGANLPPLERMLICGNRLQFEQLLTSQIENEGVQSVRAQLTWVQIENPTYWAQMKPWIEECVSVPTSEHRQFGAPTNVVIPDIDPRGDLFANTWNALLASAKLSPNETASLNLFYKRITGRQAYIGTPNPAQNPQEFRLFFENANRALKHICLELGRRPLEERQAALIGLSESGGFCGTRHFQELQYYLAKLKPDMDGTSALEQMTLKQQFERALFHIRQDVLTRIIPNNDPHIQNGIRRDMGQFLGVNSAGASYKDQLMPHMKPLERAVMTSRFFAIYTTGFILDQLYEQIGEKKISLGLLAQAIGEMGGDESSFDAEGMPTRGALLKLLQANQILEVQANAKGL